MRVTDDNRRFLEFPDEPNDHAPIFRCAKGGPPSPAGLPMRLRLYGALIGDYVYEIEFAAAEDVYYERYREAFEKLVVGMRIESISG